MFVVLLCVRVFPPCFVVVGGWVRLLQKSSMRLLLSIQQPHFFSNNRKFMTKKKSVHSILYNESKMCEYEKCLLFSEKKVSGELTVG